MAVNQVERAFRAWPVLIGVAKNHNTITYGELGDAIGVHHRAIRYVLGVIQGYCLEEGLPPLTILIINSSGKPGTGFIAYDLSHFERGLEKVWDFDWQSIGNPFEFSLSGESYNSLVSALSKQPESSGEVYARVKSRGIKQLLFRQALLKAYKEQCAFTDLSFVAGLEACHIVPWSLASDSERLDIRNGILINSFHHKLFDQGLITISTNHEILFYDPKQKDGRYSELDCALTSKLHGQKMRLPFRINQRPLPEYISRHHGIAGWEFKESEI
jgi:putative restriction endonuclease